jgi:integrase
MLSGYRGKNGQAFFVPLNELTSVLLEKYSGKLPYFENGSYNRLIKEIAAILGINKKLKTNTARKTFATVMEGTGWSRESISRMLGHKHIKTLEIYYLGESPMRVINEMSGRIDRTDYTGRHR